MGSPGHDGWTLPVPRDFRLAPTVHSHGAVECPPFRWHEGTRRLDEEGTLERALTIGSDPGRARTVQISEETAERIEIRRGGPGARPERIRVHELRLRAPGWEPDDEARVEVEEAAVFMLGLDRDLHEFHELCRGDPVLRRIPEIGAGRLLRCPALWEELCKAVLAAALPWPRAVDATRATCRRGEPADGLRTWPGSRELLDAGPAGLEAEGIPEPAASRLAALARRVEEGSLDLAAAESGALPVEGFRRLLLSVEGLDEPAADRLLILYGHTDRLPLDRAMVEVVRDARFGGRTPTGEEIEECYAKFGAWRGLACWMDVVRTHRWPEAGIPS